MRQSQIVVNVLTGNDRFEPQAINVRTFETLGVGSLLLVKSSPVLNKHFKPGKDLITFSSPQDLYKKAKYYLSHKVQADKIALNGYKIVQDKHTFIHRLKEIL